MDRVGIFVSPLPGNHTASLSDRHHTDFSGAKEKKKNATTQSEGESCKQQKKESPTFSDTKHTHTHRSVWMLPGCLQLSEKYEEDPKLLIVVFFSCVFFFLPLN